MQQNVYIHIRNCTVNSSTSNHYYKALTVTVLLLFPALAMEK